MKLSILDQAPISSGKTAYDALQTSIKLAQLGESLGYERYWIAEHHDLFGLASPNPDVMIGAIGMVTNTIKIGAGAVLLPYYKPFRVAETYNLLATLYPNRVDLGIGRAPGGSAEVSMALSDNYLQQVKKFPEHMDELIQFLQQRFPKDHLYGKISPTPVPDNPPQLWLLGTSEKSALLAADKGMYYAIGHFLTEGNGPKIVKSYKDHFKQNNSRSAYVIVAVHVMCAETKEEATEIASSTFLWSIQQDKQLTKHTVPTVASEKNYSSTESDLQKINEMKRNMIIGNPNEVKDQLISLQKQYEADELMVVTITHDEIDKFTSYQLIAEQFLSN